MNGVDPEGTLAVQFGGFKVGFGDVNLGFGEEWGDVEVSKGVQAASAGLELGGNALLFGATFGGSGVLQGAVGGVRLASIVRGFNIGQAAYGLAHGAYEVSQVQTSPK